MSGLCKLLQESLKGPFSWTALSLLYIPFFTVKDHMHIYQGNTKRFCYPSVIYLPKYSHSAHLGSCSRTTHIWFIRLWISWGFFSPLKHCQKGFPLFVYLNNCCANTSQVNLVQTVHMHMIFNVFPDLKVRFGLQISLLAIKRKKQALNLKECTLKMRFHNWNTTLNRRPND